MDTPAIPGYDSIDTFAKEVGLPQDTVIGHMRRGYARWPRLVAENGNSKHPLYKTWAMMKHRCLNKNYPGYLHYGGRGILVCTEWQISFTRFVADMGPRPPRRTLDRIDVNGNYEPGNCRWATKKQQSNNTRRSKKYEGM